ncbi:MAG TPA: hypothetical protein VK046_11265, partial [Actinomycetaceae bacterium]|nr:hypothetical protein [Actinomycetaceae bacterium]
GSGATALSAVSALIDLGVSRIVLSARSPHKLAPLRELAAAAEVPVQVVEWGSSWQLLSADVVVSALATEGAEQVAALWTDRSNLPRPGVFLDVLYDPWPAPLARVVTALGGEVADGLEMLAHQADLQVRSMLGVGSAPVAQMLAAARDVVSERS